MLSFVKFFTQCTLPNYFYIPLSLQQPQRLSEGNYTRPVLKFDLTPVERT